MNFRLVREGLDRSVEVGAGIRRIAESLGNCRSRYSAGDDFPFGSFCIADAMYAPVVSRLRTYSVPVVPGSAAYMDAVWTHPLDANVGRKGCR